MRNLNRLASCSLALALACSSTLARAQEEVEEGPVVQSQMTVIAADDGSGTPMVFSTTNLGGGPAFAFGGELNMVGGDFVMPAPDPWSMINNPSVQKDLELVGDQLKRVQEMQKEHSEEMRRQIGDLKKGGSIDLDNMKKMREVIESLQARQKEELQQLLLPHQIQRLRQVALQTHMRQAGTAGALSNAEVAEELGISEAQIKQLKEKAKELREQLEKDVKALQEKMKESLIAELTPEQQAKLKEMIGDKYEPNQDDWRERFQRAPGRIRRNGPDDN